MYLVTGGCGFIGSHLVRELLDRGETVRIFDSNAYTPTASYDLHHPRLGVIAGDIRTPSAVAEAVRDVEVIFHLAAQPSVALSMTDPSKTFAVNTEGTLNVLNAARLHDVRRVVLATTSAVYGDAGDEPISEAMLPKPRSPYAISKLAAEHLCSTYSDAFGLETVALRLFNVFGVGQRPGSAYAAVIPAVAAALIQGEAPTVFGDGEQTRDFISVSDVVGAFLSAASAPAISGEVFNIGSGSPLTINALIATIGKLLDIDIESTHLPARAGDIRHSTATIQVATSRLGFSPQTSLAVSLADVLASMRPEYAVAIR